MLTNPNPGGYAFGAVLPSADVNSVWSQLPKAVDGIGGGTYNLTAVLSLLGQLITVTDLATVADLTVGDDATIAGSCDVGGAASFRLNNVRVNNQNETLTDASQTAPIRYYTGTTAALDTLLSDTTTNFHWFFLVNAQTTPRTVTDEGPPSQLMIMPSKSWAVVAKMSTLDAWVVLFRGSLTNHSPVDFYQSAAAGTINPVTSNYALMSPNVPITLDIDAGTYQEGQLFKVVNRAADPGDTVNVRDPALASVVTVPGGAWYDILFDGTNWVIGASG